MHHFKLILFFFHLILLGLVLCDTAIEEEEAAIEEEIEHHHHNFGLKVEIYPVDVVKMYQLTEVEVHLYIQANWTLMFNLSHSVKVLPIWFRCPGVIEVVSDNPTLLEVINGTLNVTGADFFSLNHTITLKSHHVDPAFQYLQVLWTSSVPLDQCTDIFLHDEHLLPEHAANEQEKHLLRQTLRADQHLPEHEAKQKIMEEPVQEVNIKTEHEITNEPEQDSSNGPEHEANGEPEHESSNDSKPKENDESEQETENERVELDHDLKSTENANVHDVLEESHEIVDVHDVLEESHENADDHQEVNSTDTDSNSDINYNLDIDEHSLKSEILVDEPDEKFNIYDHGITHQSFKKKRDTSSQDTSDVHHHHHYDRADVPVVVPATPKTEIHPRLLLLDDYRVGVMRTQTKLDTAFVIVVTIVVAFNTFMMGMQLNLDIVVQVFKKPIGPAVGIISQFVFMPLASYGLAHLFFSDINLQLGLFTLGCSPGGNSSNFWTLLLKGDLNLSITMTFISTTCAIFMMPFWLLTLGQTILTRGQIEIPVLNLFLSLISFTIPVSIGIAIGKFRPNWAKKGKVLIRPITFIFIIVVNVMAVCNSMYIYRAMTWKTILAGLCVAWGGYLFGGTLAFIARQKKAQIIAISIETAIQNPGITFMVLRLTLDQPAADLSAVAPVSQMMVTTLPLLLLYLIIMIRRRILARMNGGQEEPEETDSKTTQNPNKDGVDVEKPLIIHNVTINPSKDYRDEKLQIKPHLKPILSPDVVNEKAKRNGSEPLYDNLPVKTRLTVIGESNV